MVADKELPMLRMTQRCAKPNGASSVTEYVAAYPLDDTVLRQIPARGVFACCTRSRTHAHWLQTEDEMGTMQRAGTVLALAAACAMACVPVRAMDPPPVDAVVDTSAGNLIVVLRESRGENKPDEHLEPYGRVVAQIADGRRVEIATSWYQYLGDMHIRLVFDGGQNLQSASPNDLERLGLSPEDALARAVANLRRMHGTAQAVPWTGGMMQVEAAEPDLASSYFLDREFWLAQQQRHPEGMVVAVPQRGELVFASAQDEDAVEALRFSAMALYAGSAGTRVSSGLYLFKDGHWSVYEAPRAAQK